ncbi:HGGxSTG domain-containing protein [Halorubrum yunnanense]|uniref:HGGxSTG domain-containing protein n=1 Tax=Halorubrum yunnanense TaxID=1526162 RepID=A0ABD5YJA5_9EURY|nr:HGGxSTG domain-containing protein [Halorubrum yunnanense]
MTDPDSCGATTRDGDPCQLPAGWGTDTDAGRCKLHGGATPSGPDHPAYTHGLYSDALREEDRDLLATVEGVRRERKLADTLNVAIVKLHRAAESGEADGKAIRDWMDTIRTLAKDLDKVADGETIRMIDDDDDPDLDALEDMAEDLF